MKSDTPFPEREEKEETYKLSARYKQLFERALNYAREAVTDEAGGGIRRRVRWWSALALLRSAQRDGNRRFDHLRRGMRALSRLSHGDCRVVTIATFAFLRSASSGA